MTGVLELATLNVGNPSLERARRQADVLAGWDADVLVLTETKTSRGCALLQNALHAAGWWTATTDVPAGSYGVLVAARVPIETDPWAKNLTYLPERLTSVVVPIPDGPLRVAGLYVPSRDATPAKVERKRRFLAELAPLLDEARDMPTVVLGDLNVLEPHHTPKYATFRAFEYHAYHRFASAGFTDAYRALHPDDVEHSWVGRTGDGYRYDHAFVSTDLAGDLACCMYDHRPRTGPDRITDHSVLTLTLARAAPARTPPPARHDEEPDLERAGVEEHQTGAAAAVLF